MVQRSMGLVIQIFTRGEQNVENRFILEIGGENQGHCMQTKSLDVC